MRPILNLAHGILWLGSPLTACTGPVHDNPPGEQTTTEAALTSSSTPSSSSSPTTTLTTANEASGSMNTTMAFPDDTSATSAEETASPPLFDLGVVPDMPPVSEPEQTFDCQSIPDQPVSYQPLVGPRGYHGLAITPDGLMLGSDGSSLIESDYTGNWGVFIPGLGNGQQMDWLLDGDLAHSTDDGAITRIRLDGTTDLIAASINAYGVVRGPDDMLYVVGSHVSRIDPDTGVTEFLFDTPESPHSLEFSPDAQHMYVGTIGNGTVYFVDLDANMNPITEPIVLSTTVGEGSGWHDAVAIDACGQLYVPDYYSRNIYRVAPNGETTLYWQPTNQSQYAHALVWGTGEHGWRADALYFPQPYNGNTVAELVVGAPSRDFQGTIINPLAGR